MTQISQPSGQVAPHPSRLSVETAVSVDVEKSRISVDSDEATVQIPFTKRRTSRKLFCAVLLIANFIFLALAIGLAVGLSLRLRNPSTDPSSSTSTPSSSTVAGAESTSQGGGGGSNRHY
ncbi:hypothetical protein TWF730_007135 [Orbilia blumenaviensis]|uniref:Uncharacterized protein n=1 Tax=Orbilia blumenaviensis TaxID=1796055 RepID=A0AAV9VGC6_9PEZI